MDKSDFDGAKALVCGLARSGMAAARLLRSWGAEVCVTDKKGFHDLSAEQKLFLEEASRSGAYAYVGASPDALVKSFNWIVISPGIPIDAGFIKKARQLSVPVIGELELGFAACEAPVIAITGTNGKTTASTITGGIMSRFAPGSETLGNIGWAFCEKAASIPKEAWATLEVSSFQLESIKNFRPKIAAVLNITEDHINRHHTMENYIAVKERIFENQRGGDMLALNYDDPVCRAMAAKTKGGRAFFSMKGRPPSDHSVYIEGGAAYYSHGAYTEKLWDVNRMRVPFAHIAEDAMAAALIAILAGAPLTAVAEEVLAFGGVPHRAEYVGRLEGVDYYNDSKATNVDSAVKALEAAQGRVVLIGGGQDKKTNFKPWVKLFKDKAKYVILLGETAGQLSKDCDEAGFVAYETVEGLKEAVKLAKTVAVPGDTVMLSPACASLDMFGSYEERGDLFKSYVLNVQEPQ